ncbi:hypothetical protein ACTXT7_003408 [Hymenolepis weldensis]
MFTWKAIAATFFLGICVTHPSFEEVYRFPHLNNTYVVSSTTPKDHWLPNCCNLRTSTIKYSANDDSVSPVNYGS